MKLGFEETQLPYRSGSQSARAWTESWVGSNAYCPNCGNARINSFPNNSPVADFYCSECNEEFELKSQKTIFRDKVLDGAYKTKCKRLEASNNPSLFLLNYDLSNLSVINLLIVPKHFFVRDIIEKRKPLASTARRAGWIGSNILLSKIPSAGKIQIVRDGIVRPKESVLADWQKTLFLRDEGVEARGWLLEVMRCVDEIGLPEFSLDEVYAFEAHLSALYPNNRHVKQKIRQQLQVLRDSGYLDFLGRGRYQLSSSVRR